MLCFSHSSPQTTWLLRGEAMRVVWGKLGSFICLFLGKVLFCLGATYHFLFQFYGLVVDGSQRVGFEPLGRDASVTIDPQHLGAYGRQQHFRIFPVAGFLPGIAQQLMAVGNKPLAAFLPELHFLRLFSCFEHALLSI